MTEKRFIYCEEENGEFPFPYIKYDGKKVISLYECVDLLNELNDENEQLKSEKKDMQILINTISDQRNEFHRGVRENANRVGKLEKENEQLKQQIHYLKIVCRNELDDETLKQVMGSLGDFE